MDDFDATDPTPNYDVSTSLGLSVILKRPRLIASSKLDVNFAWYKDDAQVYTNNTHFVTSTGDLVIVGITRNDFGNYRVIASSESFTDIVSQEYSIKDVGDLNRPQMSEMAIAIVYFTPDQTILASTLGKKEHFDCVPNTGSTDFETASDRNPTSDPLGYRPEMLHEKEVIVGDFHVVLQWAKG
ncbi:hypothetical protein WR25_06439 [Diploscapter pachys]|uniref:Ig-like domain-containing protein n=1 Tax=Diploscapter pachys TaxID=2018661 RepID=A0A2A2K8W9_9BILA|nr:hypothetical protein WR25_06439 [Diploscapter pachys]